MYLHFRARTLALLAAWFPVSASAVLAQALPAGGAISIDLSTDDGLAALGRAIGDRRIVLLGENGHGVAEFTSVKAGLIRYLHRSLGFRILALESGYYECSSVGEMLLSHSPASAARGCLGFAFEHEQIVPLFQYLRDSSLSPTGLRLAGIDLQIQANDSRLRTERLREALRREAPELADSIARLDSTLLSRLSGNPDSLRAWVRAAGASVQQAYRRGAARTRGSLHWTLRTTEALIGRMLVRDTASSNSQEAWQRRDDWMMETVLWLADSGPARTKIVVSLHNDHARYGNWVAPAGRVRAAGGLLRGRMPGTVFSIGFFMGSGEVATNSRQIRPMVVPAGELEARLATLVASPSGALVLTREEARWRRPMSYLRNGLAPDTLVPGDEFDALVYVAQVTPPAYIK